MSNILIIKHGSLGDIVQISGVLRDIREHHQGNKIFILTTFPYVEVLSKCPFVDAVLIDKRLPRWNFVYLIKLKKMIKKYNFTNVYDLQNSSRTSFYRKYLFKISNWNSADTIAKKYKENYFSSEDSVLKRFQKQLDKCNIKTRYTLKPDFSWGCKNVDKIINQYFSKKFILIFPFCSPNLSIKKWPYFNELIQLIKSRHENLNIGIVPGPKELEESKLIDAVSITKNDEPLDILELAGIIKKASYVISNDTGPAHIAAHLGKKGRVLFGKHTTPEKVSIETDSFKSISVKNLNNLNAEIVYSNIKEELNSIN